MINADEHKNLLAQINELEKKSINYFDVEKEFFLIDSDNLSKVCPRLYGYSIQQSGIYEEDNLTTEAITGLDGRGCYVYVEVKDGKITIKQDLNGSWGIYLFRYGDYFALSNSFFRLLDHVKFKYSLTVNRDYCYYQITDMLCSISCSETAINEIRLVERNAIIHIDIANKTLDFNFIDYHEHTVSLDSKEGIDTLDRWVEFWSSVLRGIAQKTKFIQADLSGGFDSRISFVHLLHSGVDLNKIRIFSRPGDLHTYKEDREIASQIAKHYGFKLNQSLPERQFLKQSITDSFNVNLYITQTFSNIPRKSFGRCVDKAFALNGSSGETLRGRWHETPSKFLQTMTTKTNHYSRILSYKVYTSIANIINSGFCTVRNKYKIEDKTSKQIPQYLYFETWSRHHFGKGSLIGHFGNDIALCPALDPIIRTLQQNTSECSDSKLLIALLFVRYAPDLLTFPFNSGRSIAPETIAYAKALNNRFPLQVKNQPSTQGEFYLQLRDKKIEKILASGQNNPTISVDLWQNILKATFDSNKTFGLLTSYFEEELYHYAALHCENDTITYNRLLYAVLGITRVLEAVEISNRNRPLYQDMKYILKQDFATIHNDFQLINKIKPYLTARIDIKLLSNSGDFRILSVSDDRAMVSKPAWFQHNGIGYIINSYLGNLDFVVKATTNGKVQIYLGGKDVRTPEDKSKRIPYWIDYTKLIVNGNVIFDTVTPAWCAKLYAYAIETKAGEEIKVHVEWLPHRSDT